MNRLSVCTWGLLLVVSVPAFGEPLIDVGRVELVYGQKDQEVQFFVTGGDEVQILNFLIQVADGGPEVPDGVISGPHITDVDLATGTIFEEKGVIRSDPVKFAQYWGAEISIPNGFVHARDPNGTDTDPGLIATVTFDTSEWGVDSIDMQWELRLKDVLEQLGGFGTDFGTVLPVIINGTLVIVVPEPSSILLLTMGGLMLLLTITIRRRRR